MNQRHLQQPNNHQPNLISILIFNQTTPSTRLNEKLFIQEFHSEYYNGNAINLKKFNSNTINTNGYLNNFNYQVNYSLGGNDSSNYYFSGVLFMISIIGLLLYVNLYYENCFTETLFRVSKWRFCFFLKYCFVISRKSTNQGENNSTKLETSKDYKKDSIEESFDYDNEYSDDEEENDENEIDEIVIQENEFNQKVKNSKRDELTSKISNNSQKPIHNSKF
jgi:hypothetical protein